MAFGGENKIKTIMAERTYNGFTNRETWLVNVFYRDQILDYSTSIESSLEFVKEEIQDQVDKHLENSTVVMVKELICSKEIVNKINWSELEDHYTKELEYQAKTNPQLEPTMHIDNEDFWEEMCRS